MLLSAIKAHHSGLMHTDRLRWIPSHPWAKSINLSEDSIFLFSLCLTCSVLALTEHATQSHTAALFYFSQDCMFLHQDEFLSSRWALLCCDISYEQAERKPLKNVKSTIQDKNATQTQQTCQQLQGYLFISRWEMTAAMSLSAHVGSVGGDSFVNCFLFCDLLCRKEARLAVSYS